MTENVPLKRRVFILRAAVVVSFRAVRNADTSLGRGFKKAIWTVRASVNQMDNPASPTTLDSTRWAFLFFFLQRQAFAILINWAISQVRSVTEIEKWQSRT